MARTSNKLTARAVASLTRPGRHSDGNGLYISIDGKGGRRWVLLFTWQGRMREMGLGSGRTVSLARARELAADARRLVAEGKDPIAARRGDKAHIATFGAVADDLVASLENGWRNPKHRAQWKMTLSVYAAPLCDVPVDKISTEDLTVAHVISEGFGRQVVKELLAEAGEDGLIGYDSEMMAR